MADHSPLPWRRDKGVQDYGGVRIEADDGVLVAWCGESTSVSDAGVAKNNPPADAALIVHRVNTWGGMLNALHDVLGAADVFTDETMLAKVSAAIAKAEGPTDA